MNGSPLELYSAYLDGHCLSEAEVVQLRAWIAADEANANEFVQFAIVHAAITDRLLLGRLLEDLATHRLSIISAETLAEAIREIESSSPRVAQTLSPSELEPEPRLDSPWATRLAVAAAAVFVLMGAWAFRSAQAPTLSEPVAPPPTVANSNRNVSPPRVAEKPVVATVGPIFDAHWTFGDGLTSGDKLREGVRLDLLSGVVQLDMASGAAVVVEGPCHVELQGAESLRLADGKAAVRIDGAADSFVVNTPTAKVTDLGTEFGVSATPSGETVISVFEGGVEVAQANDAAPKVAAAGGETREGLRIVAGFQMSVARLTNGRADFGRPLPVKNSRTFVRPDEVQVRLRAANGSVADQKLAAHYARLRIGGLLAYQGFDASTSGMDYVLGLGRQGVVALAAVNFTDPADGNAGGLDVQNGDAFMWFDTTGAGPFAEHGMLAESGLIGRTGTELWATWRTQRFRAVADEANSAGLSLMFGNQSDVEEPLFLGQAANGRVYCAQSAWGDAPPPAGKRVTADVDFDAATPGLQDLAIDDNPHTWVIRVEFRDDQDRVSVWIDADLSTLDASAPRAVLDVSSIEFDRIRMAAHRGEEIWRFGELAVALNQQALEQVASVSIVDAKN